MRTVDGDTVPWPITAILAESVSAVGTSAVLCPMQGYHQIKVGRIRSGLRDFVPGSKTCFSTLITFACVLFGVPAANAQLQRDAAFTVENYPVEAVAENAVAAKKKALTDGRNAAFRSLLKRLVPVTAYSQLTRLKDVDANALVEGVSVRSERNSPTEYIASLDFVFQADQVRGLLRSNGIPFVDEQAATSVIVPVVREDASKPAQTRARWNDTWRQLDLKNALSPLRVEELKPVIHVDTIRMAMDSDSNAERILATEYQSERVMLVVATINREAKKVDVTISGRDAVGPINWMRSYRLIDGDQAYTLELVAVVSLGVLEGRWKALKSRGMSGVGAFGSGAAQDIPIQVAFSGLQEWNTIRRRLLETPGVENIRVNSVSARGAAVALSFPGGGGPLAQVLAQQGLSLMQTGNTWVLALRY